MAGVGSGQLFLFGAGILNTTVDPTTKTITAQLGDVVASVGGAAPTATVFADGCDWFQQVGFNSRPSNPTPGKASAQAVAIRCSDRDVIVATRDLRANSIYANLQPGETCISALGADGLAQGRILLKGDDSVSIFSKNRSDGDNTIFRLGGATKKIELQAGTVKITLDGVAGTITFAAGAAGLTLDGSTGTAKLMGTNVAVQGSIAAIAGSLFTFIGKNAAPVPGTFACFGVGGVATVPSTSVYMSPT